MKRALLVALVLAASPTARAFVRSTTDSGTPVFWTGSCTWLIPDNSTPTKDLTFAAVQQTIAKSVANWQSVTLGAGCSYLKIEIDPPAAEEARLDHLNVIKFRTDKWCRPAEKTNPEMCYSTAAAAITTVFYTSQPGKPADGSIVDADIELNNINFTFANLPMNISPRPGTSVSDLENTLTHELGHFQGLDHTCWDRSTRHQPVDNTGALVPDCNEVVNHHVSDADYQRITTATMYAFAGMAETHKRMPKADDIGGICAVYAKAKDPNGCVRAGTNGGLGGGGCSVAGPPADPGSRRLNGLLASLVLLLLPAFFLSRRRRG